MQQCGLALGAASLCTIQCEQTEDLWMEKGGGLGDLRELQEISGV